jgi:hypothetical protein
MLVARLPWRGRLADPAPRPEEEEMSTNERTRKATESSTPDDARSRDPVPDSQHLPPLQGDPRDEPGTAGSPHRGQSGKAGSGEDAKLESVGESQSDRAAGKSS